MDKFLDPANPPGNSGDDWANAYGSAEEAFTQIGTLTEDVFLYAADGVDTTAATLNNGGTQFKLTVLPGAAYGHKGVPGAGYLIDIAEQYARALTIARANVLIMGIEANNTLSGAFYSTVTGDVRFFGCIASGGATGAYGGGFILESDNDAVVCLAHNGVGYGFYLGTQSSPGHFPLCWCTSVSNAGGGYYKGTAFGYPAHARNCVGALNGGADWGQSGAVGYEGEGNASSDGTEPGLLPSSSTVTAGDFTNAAGQDYSIAGPASELYDSGTDTGRPSEDIAGNPWTTNDVGAYAYVASGGVVIEAGIESLQVSTQPASVAREKFIPALAAAVQVDPLTATVTRQQDVQAQVESLAVTPLPAGVDRGKTIISSTEAIQVAGLTASITAGQRLVAELESVIVTGLPASIDRATAIQAGLEQLVLASLPGTVMQGSGIIAQPEGIEVTTLAGSVDLHVRIAAKLEDISLTTLAASIGLGRDIQALTEAIELTPLGATVDLGNVIRAGAEDIYLTTLQATVSGAPVGLEYPGLGYRLPDGRMGYRIPLSEFGYRLPIGRIHFTFDED